MVVVYLEELSKIRQEIDTLNKTRSLLITNTLHTDKLLTASFYERYTKCGSPNCKCAQGQLHGPFYWIYQNKKGKKFISTSCVSGKITEAKRLSDNYAVFKNRWAEIKKIDDSINELIGKIQYLNEKDAQEFTKKEGETRGRKQKKSNAGTQ